MRVRCSAESQPLKTKIKFNKNAFRKLKLSSKLFEEIYKCKITTLKHYLTLFWLTILTKSELTETVTSENSIMNGLTTGLACMTA